MRCSQQQDGRYDIAGIYFVLAGTRVNHTGVLAVRNHLSSSLAVGILTFVLNSLHEFNYAKINP